MTAPTHSPLTDTRKVCTSCQQSKPTNEFHRFGKNAERIGKWCESCFQRNKGGRKKSA